MPRHYNVHVAVQCEAITKAGRRCGITSTSSFKNEHGRYVAEPLRQGACLCLFHLELFSTIDVPASNDTFRIFWIDLETTGLDVLSDEILELAVTEDQFNIQFSTTVRPLHLPIGPPGVHGIGLEELLSSPSFGCVFDRFVQFLRCVIDSSLIDHDDSSDDDGHIECDHVRLPGLQDPVPHVLLVGHNAMKFDFPMLITACLMHNCNVFEMDNFYFCDTLHVIRACSPLVADGCARLQCLVRCCDSSVGMTAHRALDDTSALRIVMHHYADRLGLTPKSLLQPFARKFDANATLLARSCIA